MTSRSKKMNFAVTPGENELIVYAASMLPGKSVAEFIRENEIHCARSILATQLALGKAVPEFTEEAIAEVFTPSMREAYAKPVEQRKAEHDTWISEVRSKSKKREKP